MTDRHPKVAYVVSRFPHLTETFILREMVELDRQGYSVSLYPILVQRQPFVQPEARAWLVRARRLALLSPALLWANIRALATRPASVMGMWAQAVRENRASLPFLLRTLVLLPKATYAARLMEAEGIEHVHAHYATHPALVAWAVHRLAGIPYSITVHAHDIFVNRAMLDTKLREASFVVAISEFNRRYLGRVVGPWVEDRTIVIGCGLEEAPPQPRARRWSAGDRFEIGSVGSLQPYKGYVHLIRACAILRDEDLPFRCRIVGEGQDRGLLEGEIARLGLGGVVELLGGGTAEDVRRFLASIHCYVQPSIVTPAGKMEGIPVAIMEALSEELPVIASSLSGIPELVRHEETGCLVPPADARALAHAISECYARPDEALRLGVSGRLLVRREHDLRANVARLASLFSGAAAAPPRTAPPG